MQMNELYLKECLTYDHVNGIFVWNERPVHHFKNKSYCDRWNKRYAKKIINNCQVSNGQVNKYTRIAINHKKYFAHRLAMIYMGFDIRGKQVDHIDGDTSNNKIENLRAVTALENRKNMKLSSLNKTGISGVTVNKYGKTYRVQLKHKEKNVLNKYTDDFFEACCIRKSAEIRYGFHANHGRR